MWVSSMAWTRGAFQSHLVEAGPRGARGDVGGVVADPMVVVVLAQLGPERLQLVLGEAGAGGGDRLVQQDRGDGTAQAVAGPARDVLVLAVGRLPPPRRGVEELVVLQQGRGGLEDRDLSALLLVGSRPGQVVVKVGEPGRVVAGGQAGSRAGRWARPGRYPRPAGCSCPGTADQLVVAADLDSRCRPARCRRPRARGSSRPWSASNRSSRASSCSGRPERTWSRPCRASRRPRP